MKNLKRLMAVVLAVVMLSTVAFAAAPDGLKKNNYAVSVNPATVTQGATEFTFDIVFADITGEAIDFNPGMSVDSGIGMTLTDEAIDAGITIVEATSDVVSLVDFDTDGTYFWTQLESATAVSLTADTVLCSVKCSIPADVAVGTYKVLAGNSYDYAELIDASGESTSLIKWAEDLAVVTVEAAAQDPVITGTPARETITVGETAYSNVWIGDYSIVLNGNTATTAIVKFVAENKTFEVAPRTEGEGKVAFKIAIVGVPMNVAAPTVTIQ